MTLQKIFIFISLVFTFFVFSSVRSSADFSVGQCTAKNSICDLNWTNAKPGAPCSADPEHYVYGNSSNCIGTDSPCVPACGFIGNGRCCDPNPKNPPKISPTNEPGKLQPPPCHGKIDQKKGCASIDTAFGTLSTDVNQAVNNIFRILLGFAGGVAILLIIAAGYEMMTSQGNPEKVKGARERLTAAIVGLVFILFSVAVLQIIGVDILQLPGFSR